MGLLSICQDAATECGISKPSSIIGNNAIQARRLLRFANKVGHKLMRAHDWNSLRRVQTFTATATEEQTNVFSGITDFDRFVPETFWNTTTKYLVSGPITPVEWQGLKTNDYQDTSSKFVYRDQKVYVLPTPAAGDTMRYEYISKNWCQDSEGTAQSVFAADTDTLVMGTQYEELMTVSVAYEYQAANDLPSDRMLFASREIWRELMENENPRTQIMVAGDIFTGGPFRGGRHFTGAPTSSAIGTAWY